jgi:hypothetical protein
LALKVRKYVLLLALLLVSTVGLSYALSILFIQSYVYTVPRRGMTVTGLSTLNFGTLSLIANTTLIFNDALTVSGNSFTPITIQLVRPDTTWKRVFSSMKLVVLSVPSCSPGELCPVTAFVACVSFGSIGCFGAGSAEFTPTAKTYVYEVTYTVASGEIPSNVPLQTTWSG